MTDAIKTTAEVPATKTAKDKPHLSKSQIELACKCGEAYRRRYVEGEKIPPGIALIRGTGVHRGAETNMRQKIDSHADLPVKEIVDIAVAAFDTELAGGYVLSDDEHGRGPQNVIGDARDDVAALATLHAKEQAPDYQPILVEQLVRIELPGAPRDLLGIIDLADDRERLVDFKTSGKKPNADDVHSSVQLTVYAAAFNAYTGHPPTEVRLDTAVATKTKTYRDVQVSTRDGADFEALAHRMNAVLSVIESGAYLPATPGAWWCAPKWCGYYGSCRFVNSQRKALAEKDG